LSSEQIQFGGESNSQTKFACRSFRQWFRWVSWFLLETWQLSEGLPSFFSIGDLPEM